jgi:hypothetical protein
MNVRESGTIGWPSSSTPRHARLDLDVLAVLAGREPAQLAGRAGLGWFASSHGAKKRVTHSPFESVGGLPGHTTRQR